MVDATSVARRFWSKVDRSDAKGCWIWTGAKNGNGYGRFNRGDRLVYPHRLAYELCVGTISQGLVLDHRCRNRLCCNPTHLRLATLKQNGENRSGPTAVNTSGVLGVSWNSERRLWVVTVQHLGKSHYGGGYADIGEAELAAIALRNRLFSFNDRDREMSHAS